MGSEKSKRTTFILINVGSIKDDLKWTYDMMSCLTQVHVVCAWVLDLYYGVHGFDSFTGGLFMACKWYKVGSTETRKRKGLSSGTKQDLLPKDISRRRAIDYDESLLSVKIERGGCIYVNLQMTLFFGSTKKSACDEFEKLMKDKFQMSSIGRNLPSILGMREFGKALVQDGDADDASMKIFIRSMIGSIDVSLQHLTRYHVCSMCMCQVSRFP
ncbi:hypothetical protein Tco_1507257 [Tanacetum coccineum]